MLIILNFTVALKCTTQHNGTLHLLNRWTCCFAFHTRFKNTSDINSTSRQPRCHSAGGPPCCHFFHCSPKALKAPLLSVQRTDGAFAPTAVSRVTYWCLMFPGKVNVVLFSVLPLCFLICCRVLRLRMQPDANSQFGTLVFESFVEIVALDWTLFHYEKHLWRFWDKIEVSEVH